MRFHKHEDDARIIVHLLVELYARSLEEATEVLEQAARGALTITSLAEESRPPASAGERMATTSSRLLRLRRCFERFQLRAQLGRQPLEFAVVLVEVGQLGAPLLDVDAQQLGDVGFGDLHAARVDPLHAHGRHQADRGLPGGAVAGAAREHPREHARVLAEARPQEAAASASLRNQLT